VAVARDAEPSRVRAAVQRRRRLPAVVARPLLPGPTTPAAAALHLTRRHAAQDECSSTRDSRASQAGRPPKPKWKGGRESLRLRAVPMPRNAIKSEGGGRGRTGEAGGDADPRRAAEQRTRPAEHVPRADAVRWQDGARGTRAAVGARCRKISRGFCRAGKPGSGH
jgi:hypothetical protein